MPSTKRPLNINNLTTPVHFERRVQVGQTYVWQSAYLDVFCEFTSRQTTNVNAGVSDIAAIAHKIGTRWQAGIVAGMRINNYTEGVYLYVQNVFPLDRIHQWIQLTAVEPVLDIPITIQRPGATVKGTFGEPLSTPTTIGTCNAVFSIPRGPLIAELADRLGTLNVWSVGVPEDQDVQAGDEIIHGVTGETFVVHGNSSPQSFMALNTLTVADVRR